MPPAKQSSRRRPAMRSLRIPEAFIAPAIFATGTGFRSCRNSTFDRDMTSPNEPKPIGAPLSEKELCPEELLAGQEAAYARDIARLQARRGEFVAVDCPAC